MIPFCIARFSFEFPIPLNTMITLFYLLELCSTNFIAPLFYSFRSISFVNYRFFHIMPLIWKNGAIRYSSEIIITFSIARRHIHFESTPPSCFFIFVVPSAASEIRWYKLFRRRPRKTSKICQIQLITNLIGRLSLAFFDSMTIFSSLVEIISVCDQIFVYQNTVYKSIAHDSWIFSV